MSSSIGKSQRPNTWFRSRQGQPHDPDRAMWESIGAVLLLLAAPVVVIATALTYVGGRTIRLRWFWPASIGLVGLGAVLVIAGPAHAVGFYVSPWRSAFESLETGDGFGSVTSNGGAWLGHGVPLGVPTGLILGGMGLAITEARRPSWRERTAKPAKVTKRDEVAGEIAAGVHDEEGVIVLGVDSAAKPVGIDVGVWNMHGFFAGSTGMGKTTSMVSVATQLVANGGGLVVVDLKGDPDLVATLRTYAAANGRRFVNWSFNGPDHWNPLSRGAASELADKLIAAEDPEQKYYRKMASRYLQKMLTLLLAASETRPTLDQVIEYLRPKAFEGFLAKAAIDQKLKDDFHRYCDGLSKSALDGIVGFEQTLSLLVESEAGVWLQPGEESNTFDVGEILDEGAIAVFTLPTLRYPERCAQVGALILQDLKTAAADRLDAGRKSPVSYIAVDEFSALKGNHLRDLLVRARGAGLGVLLACQELADLNDVSPEFREQVIGNTTVKVIHRQDNPDSAEVFAKIAGTEEIWDETVQIEHRSGAPGLDGRGAATGMGSLRKIDRFRLHPNELKTLGQGEAIVLVKFPSQRIDRVRMVRRNQDAAPVVDAEPAV